MTRPASRMWSVYVALFLSGGAALVYQTTWGRMLHRVFGVGDLAVATVLAAFFLGLGLGSAAGGRLAKRLRRPALGYALLEVAIGAYALLSLLVIPNVHSLYAAVGSDASFGTLTFVRLLLALVILLPPTLMMGATLPILVKVVAARTGAQWSSGATALYVTNTLGAMVGAGATGLWLVPSFGARLSIIVAAVASVAGAALVFALWRGAAAPEKPAREADDDAAPERESPEDRATAEPTSATVQGRLRTALILAGVAGFAALAGEVIWTRVLRIIVQGTTPAFAAMLVNYLFGIAAGSLIADRLLRRGASALRLFGWTQVLLAGLIATSMFLTPQLPRVMGLLTGEGILEPHRTWVILVVSAMLLLPLALALGTSIPLAWRIAGGSAAEAPSHAGKVLAWNTIGGLAGSLAAGFVLVPTIGAEASLVALVLVHALAATVAFRGGARSMRQRALALVLPALVVVAVMLLRPSLDLPYLLHGRENPTAAIIGGPGPAWRQQLAFFEEGRNTTVSIVKSPNLLRLYNDGRPESGFGGGEPGFGVELALLGALPTLFADERDSAMVIGLGAGHTATVLLGGPYEHIDVVELEEAVVRAARVLHEAREKPFPLDDPRTELIVDDARARLVLAPPDSYDAIVSQPSHPWLAGSSALYTKEFFEEADRALKPGGVLSLWINTFRTDVPHLQSVARTLLEVFPYVQAFIVEDSSLVFAASDAPIPLDAEAGRRLTEPGLQSFLGPHGVDEVAALAAFREFDATGAQAFAEGAPLILDDRPSLEFDLAQLPFSAHVSPSNIDAALRGIPWISADSWAALPPDARLDTFSERLAVVETRPHGIARMDAMLEVITLTPDERAYLEGAIAETRGNVTGAVEGYDASELREAAQAADRLRHESRMHWRALQVARDRSVLPLSTTPLLSSAIAVDDAEMARMALATAERVRNPEDAELARVVTTWLEEGCPGLRESASAARLAQRNEHVAQLAQGCAFAAGDTERATELGDTWTKLRRSEANRQHDLGVAAERGGNHGAAALHYRRALRANSAHGPAAAGLARVLHAWGREQEAARVLSRALEQAQGLPHSTRVVADQARQLGIPLEDPAAGAAPDWQATHREVESPVTAPED